MEKNFVGGSFRDPSGRVFVHNNKIYREIYRCYAQEYERLMTCGLYDELTNHLQLVVHQEVSLHKIETPETYKIIQPEPIPFISYPYEWSFSQLKDAALLTLSIHKRALDFGMSLKDASAYNIQFRGCKPIFIDTLSFETYEEGEPWVAYRQFCQHFLAPLMLCCRKDIRLNRLLLLYMEGIPLDLASRMLPWQSYFNPGALIHMHLHARYQQKYSGQGHGMNSKKTNTNINPHAIVDNLEAVVKRLTWNPAGTEWSDYYKDGGNNYTDGTFNIKHTIVSQYIERVNPASVWDVGANCGVFSRIAAEKGINTISMDVDPAAVEINYLMGRKGNETALHPLLIDLTNPTPSIGWQLKERLSLLERGTVDLLMVLALIHHLVIGNNVPLYSLAKFLAEIGKYLVIEFISQEDSQVQLMLSTRKNIFENYNIDSFRLVFRQFYEIIEETSIEGSARTIFLMRAKY